MRGRALVPAIVASALFAGGIGMGARTAAAEEAKPKAGKVYSWTLEADTLGQKPTRSIVLGGVWSVTADSADTTVGARRLLRQIEDDDGVAFHYLVFTRPTLNDLEASVRFRIVSGEIDPAAGLLFQMDRKGTSGYLLRVSGQTNEVIFHYLLYGKRRDVKFAKIDPPEPGTWHTISISRKGAVLRASYDGKECFMVRDERFSKGNLGLWAEDDTVVDFADLTATAR